MKYSKIIYILSCLFFIVSCQKALKNVDDYFVKVKTVDAIIQQDGSLLLKGEVENPGASDAEYVGFSYSTSSDPKIEDNQIIAELNGNTFETVVYGLSFDSSYYFRTWATNYYGYSYGNILFRDSIIGTPVVAPCNISLNKVSTNGSQYHDYWGQSQTVNVDGDKVYTCQTGSGPTVYFTCGSNLTTGMYKTTKYQNPEPGTIKVNFYEQFTSGTLEEDIDIYINRNDAGDFEVEICDGIWLLNGSTQFPFKTHLILLK